MLSQGVWSKVTRDLRCPSRGQSHRGAQLSLPGKEKVKDNQGTSAQTSPRNREASREAPHQSVQENHQVLGTGGGKGSGPGVPPAHCPRPAPAAPHLADLLLRIFFYICTKDTIAIILPLPRFYGCVLHPSEPREEQNSSHPSRRRLIHPSSPGLDLRTGCSSPRHPQYIPVNPAHPAGPWTPHSPSSPERSP